MDASPPPYSPVKHVLCVLCKSEQIKGAQYLINITQQVSQGVKTQIQKPDPGLTLSHRRMLLRAEAPPKSNTPKLLPNLVTSRQREGTKSQADF